MGADLVETCGHVARMGQDRERQPVRRRPDRGVGDLRCLNENAAVPGPIQPAVEDGDELDTRGSVGHRVPGRAVPPLDRRVAIRRGEVVGGADPHGRETVVVLAQSRGECGGPSRALVRALVGIRPHEHDHLIHARRRGERHAAISRRSIQGCGMGTNRARPTLARTISIDPAVEDQAGRRLPETQRRHAVVHPSAEIRRGFLNQSGH